VAGGVQGSGDSASELSSAVSSQTGKVSALMGLRMLESVGAERAS